MFMHSTGRKNAEEVEDAGPICIRLVLDLCCARDGKTQE
jgi:hypothetical protein